MPEPLSIAPGSDGHAVAASQQAMLARIRQTRQAIVEEVRKRIVGQEEAIDQVLTALFAGGHCMIQGPPGTAKTILIASLARVVNLSFKRIQFTPDLMPSDISGTEILEEDQTTGRRITKFVPGPVFCNIVMADEINRTPPKTQAALLEVMQEKQVTVGGKTNPLPTPFYVLATQINMEQEGTYPLPEAQQDRFMLSVVMNYMPENDEVAVVWPVDRRGPDRVADRDAGAGLAEVSDSGPRRGPAGGARKIYCRPGCLQPAHRKELPHLHPRLRGLGRGPAGQPEHRPGRQVVRGPGWAGGRSSGGRSPGDYAGDAAPHWIGVPGGRRPGERGRRDPATCESHAGTEGVAGKRGLVQFVRSTPGAVPANRTCPLFPA